jgi:GDP-L-fucose synthase
MRVLVLGGHGFAGRSVVKALQSVGHDVVVASRRDGLDLTVLDQTLEWFTTTRPDVVVNCAALVGSLHFVTERAAEVVDTNLRMLTNVYRALAERLPHAVLLQPVANCAFPGELTLYREQDLWSGPIHRSVLSYGSTRRMMTVLAECYAMQHKVRTVTLYTPNMYGPFDSPDPNKAHALNALCARVVKAHISGEDITAWGTGSPVREWLYAGDFARVVAEVIGSLGDPRWDTPFNIGQKDGLSISALLDLVIASSGYQGNVHWNRDMPDGAPRKVMDDTLFRQQLPDFEFTPLAEGIDQTVAWYRQIYPY